nr:MAG TPA: hypothetical protein [Caudoviricetes sp.]
MLLSDHICNHCGAYMAPFLFCPPQKLQVI